MTIPQWKKSSRSAQEAECIELANTGLVRDSKNPAGPVLALPICGLLAAVKAGRLPGC